MQQSIKSFNNFTFGTYATSTSTTSSPYSYSLDNLLLRSSFIANSNACSIVRSYTSSTVNSIISRSISSAATFIANTNANSLHQRGQHVAPASASRPQWSA